MLLQWNNFGLVMYHMYGKLLSCNFTFHASFLTKMLHTAALKKRTGVCDRAWYQLIPPPSASSNAIGWRDQKPEFYWTVIVSVTTLSILWIFWSGETGLKAGFIHSYRSAMKWRQAEAEGDSLWPQTPSCGFDFELVLVSVCLNNLFIFVCSGGFGPHLLKR